jgi:hypothetical protein
MVICIAASILIISGCGGGKTGAAGVPDYPKAINQEMKSNLPSDLPQQFAPNASRYPLTASKAHKIVHRRDCAQTDLIAGGDREYFRAFKQAQEQEYQPCQACRPDIAKY